MADQKHIVNYSQDFKAEEGAQPRVRLWTAWGVYEGTGEGVMLLARIDHAETEAGCRDAFKEAFGSFWPCIAEAGLVRNDVTTRLFSSETLDWVQSQERRANVQLEARLHFRFS